MFDLFERSRPVRPHRGPLGAFLISQAYRSRGPSRAGWGRQPRGTRGKPHRTSAYRRRDEERGRETELDLDRSPSPNAHLQDDPFTPISVGCLAVVDATIVRQRHRVLLACESVHFRFDRRDLPASVIGLAEIVGHVDSVVLPRRDGTGAITMLRSDDAPVVRDRALHARNGPSAGAVLLAPSEARLRSRPT